MDSISLWRDISKKTHQYPSLEKDLEVDVVIIGGGITGITAANELMKQGKTVAVIEAHEMGGVTTGYSTGNLYVPVQPLYQSINSHFDLEKVKTVAHSRQFAIDYIESMIKEKDISCHFKKRPWYAYTSINSDCLQKEVELLKKSDIEIDYTDSIPLNLPFKKAVVMPNQARFNPLQYVISLAQELHAQGCHLYEQTRALKIEEKSECTVTTQHGKITAKKVFIATHSPIGINLTQTFTAPYRSYVVAVTLKDNTYPEGHFWDLDKPTHAICTHPISKAHPELLLVAGSHHKTGQDSNALSHYKELEKFLRHHFDVDEMSYQWSAQHFHSADSIPYIGLAHHGAKNTYMATGYFADGLVYGTLAGILIGNVLMDKHDEITDTYNSSRTNLLNAAPFLLKENSNVFLQYVKDLPLFTSPKYKDLKKGEGRVVEINMEKCAVSRDMDDNLHVVSAVCTHMKGVVSWNNAEQSWDCPCHGSRFTPNGEVIDGPAIYPLHQYNRQILDKED